jgi:hypothetical protein
MNVLPGEDVHLGTVLVEECGSLQRGLPTSDHGDNVTFIAREVTPLRGVADQLRGQRVKWRRDPVEIAESDGDDDPSGRQGLARVQRQTEPPKLVTQFGDQYLLEVADDLSLDVGAVVRERGDRDRLMVLLSSGAAIFGKRWMSIRRCQAGGESD